MIGSVAWDSCWYIIALLIGLIHTVGLHSHAWQFQLGSLLPSSESLNILLLDDEDSPVLDNHRHNHGKGPIQDSITLSMEQHSWIQGCENYFKDTAHLCAARQLERIQRNVHQPSSSCHQNFTKTGFQTITLPHHLTASLQEFWNHNQPLLHATREVWNVADIYTNHWESPTFYLNLGGDGDDTKQHLHLIHSIIHSVKSSIEDWTGVLSLQTFTYYGIRIYQQGAIIPTHVDRYPIAFTAMMHVAQDEEKEEEEGVHNEWPIEIHGHDGIVYNITLHPGQVLLYESMSIIHGRPVPLKGKYYATFYIHFYIPQGDSYQKHEQDFSTIPPNIEQVYQQRLAAMNVHTTSVDSSSSSSPSMRLPHYIIPQSIEARRWLQQLKYSPIPSSSSIMQQQTPAAHYAAIYNDLRALKRIAKNDKASLFASDNNGWTPLHEASRAGHTRIVQFLLQQGVDVNARTHDGRGESALYLSMTTLGKEHPVVQLLQQHGGKDIPPDWIQPQEPKQEEEKDVPRSDESTAVEDETKEDEEGDMNSDVEAEEEEEVVEEDEEVGGDENIDDDGDDDTDNTEEADYDTDEL